MPNKNQNILNFCIIYKKTVHYALKCIEILEYDNFRASCTFFWRIYLNFIHFVFLFIKVFWPGKIQFLEFFLENLQVCLLFIDKNEFKLFYFFFIFKKSHKITFLNYKLNVSGKIQFSEFFRFLLQFS